MPGKTIAYRRAGATPRARHLRREETDAEYRLWRRLSGRELAGYKFTRQVPLGPYVVDFLCRAERLVVELDGEQHADSEKDVSRTSFLNGYGYSVLRFWNFEVLREREAVLDAILAILNQRLRDPNSGLRFAPATLTLSLRDSTSPVPGEEGSYIRQKTRSAKDFVEGVQCSSPGTGEV